MPDRYVPHCDMPISGKNLGNFWSLLRNDRAVSLPKCLVTVVRITSNTSIMRTVAWIVLFSFFSVKVMADVDVSLDDMKNIKSYTLKSFISDAPGLEAGEIIKLKFPARSSILNEPNDGSFTTWVCNLRGENERVAVRVPLTVRGWFLKIPANFSDKTFCIFGKVEIMQFAVWPAPKTGVEFIGTEMHVNFKNATIRWAGQESQH